MPFSAIRDVEGSTPRCGWCECREKPFLRAVWCSLSKNISMFYLGIISNCGKNKKYKEHPRPPYPDSSIVNIYPLSHFVLSVSLCLSPSPSESKLQTSQRFTPKYSSVYSLGTGIFSYINTLWTS